MTSFAGPATSLGAAAVLGTADFAGGLFSKRHAAVVVAGWSHVTTFVLLGAVCLVAGTPDGWGWLPWAVLAGACSGLGLVAYYAALGKGTMGVVAPIASAGVVVPVLFGLATGEHLGITHVAGIVIAITGIVLAAGPEFRSGERHRGQAILLAAISGIAFGVMTVGIMMGAQTSGLFTQFGMRGTSSAGFILYALWRRSTGRVRAADIGLFALLGAFDVCGNLLVGIAGTLGLMSISAVIVSLYSVVTILLAAVFLKERMSGLQWAGVAAALAGIVLMNV